MEKYGIVFIKMMIYVNFFGFNPIKKAMAYIMYFIFFQCITMIDSKNIYDFYDFFGKNLIFTFLA